MRNATWRPSCFLPPLGGWDAVIESGPEPVSPIATGARQESRGRGGQKRAERRPSCMQTVKAWRVKGCLRGKSTGTPP